MQGNLAPSAHGECHQRSRRFNRGNNRIKVFCDLSVFVSKASVKVEEVYTPQHQFSDFNICNLLKQNIAVRGYVTPTPIQDQTIPPILQGRDVIGIASTGTGKTAAFLIPLINKVFLNRSNRVLIVAPTRELAVQIEDELRIFTERMGIYSALCIGGASLSKQINQLKRHPNFVIGTPGRLKDLESQRYLNFINYNSLVLDEVDRMLDMGFINDIRDIVSHLSKVKQTLFFSATMPPETRNLANSFLINPISVSVQPGQPSDNVDQDIVRVNGGSKVDILHGLLRQEGFEKVLIFGRTKHGVEKLAKALAIKGVSVVAIHGNKSQNQRQRALESFKSNQVRVLLATDLASRGLDIDDITHVINYELPESYEAYIHRIGRTGRLNKKGAALTFVD